MNWYPLDLFSLIAQLGPNPAQMKMFMNTLPAGMYGAQCDYYNAEGNKLEMNMVGLMENVK